MNRDQILGRCKQLFGGAQAQWGSLTHSTGHVMAGRRGQLEGEIQHCYGLAIANADRQLAQWRQRTSDSGFDRIDGETQHRHGLSIANAYRQIAHWRQRTSDLGLARSGRDF